MRTPCSIHLTAGARPSGECIECSRLSHREYYVKNKAEILARHKLNYASSPKKAEGNKRWNAANKARVATWNKEYIASRPNLREKDKANHREKYALDPSNKKRQNSEWRSKNRDRMRELVAKWTQRNKHVVSLSLANRKAKLLNATPSWSIKFFVEEAYRLAKLRTEMTGVQWHVDHIVPLQSKVVCGLHSHTNLRVIPAVINLAKGNRFIDKDLENVCVL